MRDQQERINELLEANNRYLERARTAERKVRDLGYLREKLHHAAYLASEDHGLEEYRNHQDPMEVAILTTRGGGRVLTMDDILELARRLV